MLYSVGQLFLPYQQRRDGMRLLTVLMLGACLFVFGCSGGEEGASSTDGASSSGTEVAQTCPGCGEALVDGKCAA